LNVTTGGMFVCIVGQVRCGLSVVGCLHNYRVFYCWCWFV